MSRQATTSFFAAHRRPSIKVHLILMNLILLCLLFPTISIFLFSEITTFRDAQLERTILLLRQGLEDRAVSMTRSLALSAEQAMAGYDYTFLNNMMAQIVDNDPEIIYTMVMSAKGQVIAHNRIDMIGLTLEDPLTAEAMAILKKNITSLAAGPPNNGFQVIKGRMEKNDRYIPVMEIIGPVHSGKQLLGVLRCGFSLERLNNEINRTKEDWTGRMSRMKLFFLSITAIFFIIGLLVALFFSRFFIRSTSRLSAGTKLIAEGNLEYKITIDQMFCKEFAQFAEGFNTMTSRLRLSLNQLDEYNRSLEHKVQERTRDLEAAQAELLQQAHEAGMAEMAVGVLHNIGNAITPAKVDATLLSRHLRQSPIRTSLTEPVRKIIAALDNPEQLSTAEKERLCEIITLLPATIREEFDHAITKLSRISSQHEHIEGIIGLQMRYAKLLGSHEEVDLNLVIEDALKMLNETIKNRGIEVKKKLAEIPLIKIEQAKVIQIVINLIKNGYEAMDMAELPERCLTISTSIEHQQVVLSIKDTGCGFTPEESEKIFQFGFTTKGSGSGFGLHSCANFMTANNGSLTASSPGKGQGAEFIAKFPSLQPPTQPTILKT